ACSVVRHERFRPPRGRRGVRRADRRTSPSLTPRGTFHAPARRRALRAVRLHPLAMAWHRYRAYGRRRSYPETVPGDLGEYRLVGPTQRLPAARRLYQARPPRISLVRPPAPAFHVGRDRASAPRLAPERPQPPPRRHVDARVPP